MRTHPKAAPDSTGESDQRRNNISGSNMDDASREKYFRLDSICPTGVGKVGSVKIETADKRWPGSAVVKAPFEVWSAGMNGDGREKARAVASGFGTASRKAQKEGTLRTGCGRDYTVIRGFSRSRLTGQRHGQRNGAPLSAAMDGNGREKTRTADPQRNVLERFFSKESQTIGARKRFRRCQGLRQWKAWCSMTPL